MHNGRPPKNRNSLETGSRTGKSCDHFLGYFPKTNTSPTDKKNFLMEIQCEELTQYPMLERHFLHGVI